MVMLTINECVNVIPHNNCLQKREMKTEIRIWYIVVI